MSRRSLSRTRPDAPYHAVSQTPDIVEDDTRLSVDESALADEVSSLSEHDIVDTRIQWTYLLLGCAVLLPWNAMITATPFFLSRLTGSPLKATFSSYLSSTFTAANFGFLARATATSKQSSPSRRVFVTSTFLAFLVSLLTLSTFIKLSPSLFFAFVIANGIFQACAGAYLSTAVYAGASLFGPKIMQSVMSGHAIVAVIVSGVQVVSSAASVWGSTPETIAEFVSEGEVTDGSAEERSAFIFFGVSTLFMILTVAAHAWMTTLPIYKAVMSTMEHQRKVVTVSDGESEEVDSLVTLGRKGHHIDGKNQIIRVLKTNLPYEFAAFYVFVVTLSVFPPITISIRATNPNTHPLLFSAMHFLVFNIGDYLGRYICSFPRLLTWSAQRLLTLSLSRTLFIPLFLMCNVQRPFSTVPTAPIISSDLLYMSILCLFGLSNGYISTMCMMGAPSLERNLRLKGRREDVDVAATVTNFFVVAGLVAGSITSFAVRGAICDCNPFRS